MPGGKLVCVLCVVATSALGSVAEDLDAAIALYEAKKSESAVKALKAVVADSEASFSIRARAHLYIGLALAKLSENVAANAAFADAFQLDPSLTIPFGTRPDIAQRAEQVRAEVKARLEAKQDMAEWSSPTGLPPPPLPQAEPAAPPPTPAPGPVAAPDPILVAPPLPVLPAPPPAPVAQPLPPPEPRRLAVRREVEPPSPDDGLHVGLGMRFIWNPLDEVVGPGAELNFGSQSGGRRLAALLTVFPGRQWGVGGALRILFGPVIKRWRIEFGFDLGAIVYPAHLQAAFEVSTRVLGFSFPAGPVRVNVQLLTAAVYVNFFSKPISGVPALAAGFGVEY